MYCFGCDHNKGHVEVVTGYATGVSSNIQHNHQIPLKHTVIFTPLQCKKYLFRKFKKHLHLGRYDTCILVMHYAFNYSNMYYHNCPFLHLLINNSSYCFTKPGFSPSSSLYAFISKKPIWKKSIALPLHMAQQSIISKDLTELLIMSFIRFNFLSIAKHSICSSPSIHNPTFYA